MPDTPSDATQLLSALGVRDGRASVELFPLVYDELRQIAGRQFEREANGHTLQPTALVHEAWLRLVNEKGERWADPAYFFAAAAEAMRRILVEHARRNRGPVRGGDRLRLPLEDAERIEGTDAIDWLVFDDALQALAAQDARAAEVVRLRAYAGLEVERAAEVLGVSPATVKREWAYARAWLRERWSAD
jgi:RNA polymerase sigma factor (TIGR02999 family)